MVVQEGEAFKIAASHHPRWESLRLAAKKLHARNSHQILGWDLKTPCALVLCYTENGSGRGGTGQALRIAKDHGIPILDIGGYGERKAFVNDLTEIVLNKEAPRL